MSAANQHTAKNGRLKVAVLCGGPSKERGISLNSARSVCDHLESAEVAVVPIYFDHKCQAYEISRGQLYSNTPSDFDFKLRKMSKPLDEQLLIERLKSVDLVFPAIHGRFGEDGELQSFLERIDVPFVGSPSKACEIAFDKYVANNFIRERGFYAIPSLLLEKYQTKDYLGEIERFFKENRLKRAIVKPCRGGSSIAVYSVTSPDAALFAANNIFNQGLDTRLVVEPFCEGREFTVIILENDQAQPVALFPIEVEMDYRDNQIFDYRRKYLSSRMVTYHCPARFSAEIIAKIRAQAQQLFTLFGMRDFARFDGWVLDNGELYFPDFNPISGMEQNSFLFIQGAQAGMSHHDALSYVLRRACKRSGIAFEPKRAFSSEHPRKRVNVIFGGATAERHVSVMSGTNVWLKLRQSEIYEPKPYLLDVDHNVWELPYGLALYHTVEEITELCKKTSEREARIKLLREQVVAELNPPAHLMSERSYLPRKLTIEQFIAESSLVFVALHGGFGENGEFQALLEAARVPYTGSGPEASQIGMDKARTGEAIAFLANHGVCSAKKKAIEFRNLTAKTESEWQWFWNNLKSEFKGETLIVKPLADGCSAGVARLFNASDLMQYINHVRSGELRIPANTLTNQENIIELSPVLPERLLIEEFIETAQLQVRGNELYWPENSPDWVEITVGVLGKRGAVRALSPSITVASSSILSLEEKFQGGTGINITPPPEEYVPPAVVERARKGIELVANALGISGFARIDAFLNVKNGELIIIEANTIPGLTPSTVIYHQALAESPPLYPRGFLERVLEYRREF